MRLADECRPLHGRPSLGLTVEQFLCPRRRLKDDDLVIGVDVSLSPLRELDLYLRAIIDGSIVWVADGADLSRHPGRVRAVPAAACGLWGPLKLERSRSQDKSARLRVPAARFATSGPSTPKPDGSITHANKSSPTANGATTCARCWSSSKANSRAPAPGAGGSTTPSNPKNSHPTGNHHPHHHTNSTTSPRSDPLQSSAGRRTPSSAPSPGCSSSRCRAPNRETRTT